MSEALYDRPGLFAAYRDMREQEGRLNEIVEQPALRSVLPDPRGRTAVDLGCGAGAMCRWLVEQGAADVTGIDASERMLSEARKLPGPTYLKADLDNLVLPPERFDLVLSSLALHYVSPIDKLVRQIAGALRPSGSFVFSIEHPIMTCNTREWATGPDGSRQHWPVDRYGDEGRRIISWLGFDDIPRIHRPLARYIAVILDAGLILRTLLEPTPSAEAVARWPRLADQTRRPPFLIIRADKA